MRRVDTPTARPCRYKTAVGKTGIRRQQVVSEASVDALRLLAAGDLVSAIDATMIMLQSGCRTPQLTRAAKASRPRRTSTSKYGQPKRSSAWALPSGPPWCVPPSPMSGPPRQNEQRFGFREAGA